RGGLCDSRVPGGAVDAAHPTHSFGRFAACACVYHPERDLDTERRNQAVWLSGGFELLSQVKTKNVTSIRKVRHISGLNRERSNTGNRDKNCETSVTHKWWV